VITFFEGKQITRKSGNSFPQKKFVTPVNKANTVKLLNREISPIELTRRYHGF